MNFDKCNKRYCKKENKEVNDLKSKNDKKFKNLVDKLVNKKISYDEFQKQDKIMNDLLFTKKNNVLQCQFSKCNKLLHSFLLKNLKIVYSSYDKKSHQYKIYKKYYDKFSKKFTFQDLLQFKKDTSSYQLEKDSIIFMSYFDILYKCHEHKCKKEKKIADDKELKYISQSKKISNDWVDKKINSETFIKKIYKIRENFHKTKEKIDFVDCQLHHCYDKIKDMVLFNIESKLKNDKNNKLLLKYKKIFTEKFTSEIFLKYENDILSSNI